MRIYVTYDIATKQKATGHVFALTRITFDHLIRWLETGIRYVSNRDLLKTSSSKMNGHVISN